jgi:cysteine desulfuration protein SufE
MNYQQIRDKLITSRSWQQSYREIMMLAKELPKLPDCLKTDEALIKGCESKVWLHIDLDENQQNLILAGDSDTRIVKGLFAIIISMYSGIPPAQAKQIDAYTEFEDLGLIKHLSPSRGNGVRAIIETIQRQLSQW